MSESIMVGGEVLSVGVVRVGVDEQRGEVLLVLRQPLHLQHEGGGSVTGKTRPPTSPRLTDDSYETRAAGEQRDDSTGKSYRQEELIRQRYEDV